MHRPRRAPRAPAEPPPQRRPQRPTSLASTRREWSPPRSSGHVAAGSCGRHSKRVARSHGPGARRPERRVARAVGAERAPGHPRRRDRLAARHHGVRRAHPPRGRHARGGRRARGEARRATCATAWASTWATAATCSRSPAANGHEAARAKRRGRLLPALLGGLLIAAVVAAVLSLSGGEDEPPPRRTAQLGPTATLEPLPGMPRADATARLVRRGGRDRLELRVTGLPRPRGAYAVWLYSSVTRAKQVGRFPTGDIELDAPLPRDADTLQRRGHLARARRRQREPQRGEPPPRAARPPEAVKRGEILIVVLAAVAVGVVALLSAGGGDDGKEPAKAGAGSVRVSFAYSPEKERLLKPLIERFNEEGNQSGGKPVFVEGESVASGEAETQDRQRQAEARGVVAGLVAVGQAAELRRRPAAGAEGEPVDRAHAAGDRDVGAVREGAGLPEEADRVRAGARAGSREARLRRLRPAPVRRLQAGAHQPRLLHLGAVGGGGRVLRGHRPARGPDREAGDLVEGPRLRAGHRALDRPLRRHHAVHRRPDAQAGPGLRLGGGDGGGDAAGLQPQPRRASRRWWRCIRPRAPSTPTTPTSPSTRPGSGPSSATRRRCSSAGCPSSSRPSAPGPRASAPRA